VAGWGPESSSCDVSAASLGEKPKRCDLKAAGVKRAALDSDDPNIDPLRFHDLRATFVIWARRAQMTDAWRLADLRTNLPRPTWRCRSSLRWPRCCPRLRVRALNLNPETLLKNRPVRDFRLGRGEWIRTTDP
jgi:hypothetical protein